MKQAKRVLNRLWRFLTNADYQEYEAEMWRLYRAGHDIGILPGGHMIHYSVCWCKKTKGAKG